MKKWFAKILLLLLIWVPVCTLAEVELPAERIYNRIKEILEGHFEEYGYTWVNKDEILFDENMLDLVEYDQFAEEMWPIFSVTALRNLNENVTRLSVAGMYPDSACVLNDPDVDQRSYLLFISALEAIREWLNVDEQAIFDEWVKSEAMPLLGEIAPYKSTSSIMVYGGEVACEISFDEGEREWRLWWEFGENMGD